MSATLTPRLDILPPAQLRLWQELSAVPADFVLYGGTAIALHLGHRHSVDFDFFSAAEFDPDRLYGSLPFLTNSRITQKGPDTLTCIVDRGDPVQVSFFSVPKLGRVQAPLRAADNGLQVASLLDLAGAKAAVVQKRAEAKDYLDLHALIAAGTDLPHALAAGGRLYGASFNPEITLKALSYFGDGNLHTLPQGVRDRLAAAVAAVQLEALPILPGSTP